MHILILPSWYPTHAKDIRGVFIRDQVLALSARGHKIGVVAPILNSVKKIFSGELKTEIPRMVSDQSVPTYRQRLWAIFPKVPYANYFLWSKAANRLFRKYIFHYGLPDLIHAHSSLYAGAVAAKWQERFGIPFVLTEHNSAFARDVLSGWQLRLAIQSALAAKAKIAVSPSLADLLAKKLNKAGGDWQWIPNLVAPRFSYVQGEKKDSKRNLRLLNIGKMEENKGHSDLLKAFAKLVFSDLEIELWLVNNGPLKKALQKQAHDLGIAEHVRFIGQVQPEQMPDIMKCADLLVIASRYETFAVVAIEALMCGIPVVATRCGGPENIIEEGDGKLVPAKDPDMLAEAVKEVISILPGMDKAAIASRAYQRFSKDAVVKQLEKVYTSVLD